MGLGLWEILALVFVVLLVFGAGRLPRLMGDLGQGVRSFKNGLSSGGKPEASDSDTADRNGRQP
jgi:sec-independent protein translocase protein TatA